MKDPRELCKLPRANSDEQPAIVLVDWNDASFALGTPDAAESAVVRQRSVGWRCKAPKGFIRVAQSMCDGEPHDYLTVPVGMVVQITILRPATEPPKRKR